MITFEDLKDLVSHLQKNLDGHTPRIEKLENPLTRALVNESIENLHERLEKLEQERDRRPAVVEPVICTPECEREWVIARYWVTQWKEDETHDDTADFYMSQLAKALSV